MISACGDFGGLNLKLDVISAIPGVRAVVNPYGIEYFRLLADAIIIQIEMAFLRIAARKSPGIRISREQTL